MIFLGYLFLLISFTCRVLQSWSFFSSIFIFWKRVSILFSFEFLTCSISFSSSWVTILTRSCFMGSSITPVIGACKDIEIIWKEKKVSLTNIRQDTTNGSSLVITWTMASDVCEIVKSIFFRKNGYKIDRD